MRIHSRGARRDEFARACLPLVRSYLGERWRGSPLASGVEDAAQDVLIEFMRGGAAGDAKRPGAWASTPSCWNLDLVEAELTRPDLDLAGATEVQAP